MIRAYFKLAWKQDKTKWVLITQISALIILMLLFGIYLPWMKSNPIELFPIEKYGEPEKLAKYYGVNHAVPYFYEDSPKERPILFYSVITVFSSLYIYILSAIIYVYRVNGYKYPWSKQGKSHE